MLLWIILAFVFITTFATLYSIDAGPEIQKIEKFILCLLLALSAAYVTSLIVLAVGYKFGILK